MNYEVRALTDQDQPIVWEMLTYAVQEASLQIIKAQERLARYAANWGQNGDTGFVAYTEKQSIGAAWLRSCLKVEKRFGYAENSIAELAMGVIPEYRGQGIGTALLMQVIKSAEKTCDAVSLNVRSDNPAVALYQRSGFIKVEGSEFTNRAGGTSFYMIKVIHCD